MPDNSRTYPITLSGVHRELPFVRPTPNTLLPFVEFLGDVELTTAGARALLPLVPSDSEFLFTCETSSLPLVHVLAELSGLSYEVARKRRRPYMQDPLIQEVDSMTFGVGETLWLSRVRAAHLKGKRVAIVLDVIASGGTLSALEKMTIAAGGVPCARLAVFTYGDHSIPGSFVQQLPLLHNEE